jgi:hypothetical protein
MTNLASIVRKETENFIYNQTNQNIIKTYEATLKKDPDHTHFLNINPDLALDNFIYYLKGFGLYKDLTIDHEDAIDSYRLILEKIKEVEGDNKDTIFVSTEPASIVSYFSHLIELLNSFDRGWEKVDKFKSYQDVEFKNKNGVSFRFELRRKNNSLIDVFIEELIPNYYCFDVRFDQEIFWDTKSKLLEKLLNFFKVRRDDCLRGYNYTFYGVEELAEFLNFLRS